MGTFYSHILTVILSQKGLINLPKDCGRTDQEFQTFRLICDNLALLGPMWTDDYFQTVVATETTNPEPTNLPKVYDWAQWDWGRISYQIRRYAKPPLGEAKGACKGFTEARLGQFGMEPKNITPARKKRAAPTSAPETPSKPPRKARATGARKQRARGVTKAPPKSKEFVEPGDSADAGDEDRDEDLSQQPKIWAAESLRQIRSVGERIMAEAGRRQSAEQSNPDAMDTEGDDSDDDMDMAPRSANRRRSKRRAYEPHCADPPGKPRHLQNLLPSGVKLHLSRPLDF
ncbi:hypothetical protein B0T18DRAFT_390625 [Schizothecium vesticola]|uniref:Uncharacterized protein n=1 Tax=Schizothecium vesticola TaxID=314040 RepID=A0AA40K500_9PEZI|nr:hypothetical protein B0T18DRAFT_390625 [Schizothecium vesticola]